MTGILNIATFDRDNYVIAGTFEFNAIDQVGDTIVVTQGVFDLRE